jgi:subtilisin family serine protease
VKNGPLAKLGPFLQNLYDEYNQSAKKGSSFETRNPVLKVRGGKVGIDMYANDPAALVKDLKALGATNIVSEGALVAAQVPVSALAKLAGSNSLKFGNPVMAAVRAVDPRGKVVSQGVRSLKLDTRSGPDAALDGSGVTIGVLSDSFECNPPAFFAGQPTSTKAQDIASADLPADTTVLNNGACPGSDEGRGMAQLAHDVAPGSPIKFHSAFNSLTDFALGMLRLNNAGSKVIVDDVIYFAENMFSDGILAQAADATVTGSPFNVGGATYFSSAGNQARLSYEAPYNEVSIGAPASGNLNGNGTPATLHVQDFGGGDTVQKVHIDQGGFVLFSFQWDQPFITSTFFAHLLDGKTPAEAAALAKGATGDLDLLIYDENGVLVPLCPPGVSKGITCQLAGQRNIGGDAVDITLLFNGSQKGVSNNYFLRIIRAGGTAPAHVKWVAFEFAGTMQVLTHDTKSGTAYGHANAANVIGVGASSFYLTGAFDAEFSAEVKDTPGACVPACLNDFSSAGNIPAFLDKFGNPNPPGAQTRFTPWLTGPDGGNTTFFFRDTAFDDDDGDGCNSAFNTFITPCLGNIATELPNFFGTSASAPHTAAVAALMLQKNPGLTAAQVRDIMKNASADMTKREVEIRPAAGVDSIFSPIDPGFDFDSGFGFLDGAQALTLTPNP